MVQPDFKGCLTRVAPARFRCVRMSEVLDDYVDGRVGSAWDGDFWVDSEAQARLGHMFEVSVCYVVLPMRTRVRVCGIHTHFPNLSVIPLQCRASRSPHFLFTLLFGAWLTCTPNRRPSMGCCTTTATYRGHMAGILHRRIHPVPFVMKALPFKMRYRSGYLYVRGVWMHVQPKEYAHIHVMITHAHAPTHTYTGHSSICENSRVEIHPHCVILTFCD